MIAPSFRFSSKGYAEIALITNATTVCMGCCHWFLVLIVLLTLSTRVITGAETKHLPLGKHVDAPEVEAVLTPSKKGRLFTLNHVPKFTDNVHSFWIPNTKVPGQLVVNSKNAELKADAAYVVTDVAQMAEIRSGEKIVTTLIELHRIRGSEISQKDDDIIIYEACFVVTGSEAYDEELFITAMGMYFDSVAQELRLGRDYAGKTELEGSRESIQTMINLIGLDWMIGGKNYKGLIQKEKAKKGSVADFYVLKFESPIPAKSGEKFTPAFARDDTRHPFYNFNSIVIDSQSVSVGGVFHHFEVRVIDPK